MYYFYIKYAMRLLWSFWKYLEVFRLNLNYILIVNSYLKIVYTIKTKNNSTKSTINENPFKKSEKTL